MKKEFWDFIRPLHSPVTRSLRRILSSNFAEHPEMQLPPPYEAVQLDAERYLHRYLHTTPDEIKYIVIVGANTGDEVPRLRHSYASCEFLCFEPSPRWFDRLTARFQNTHFVHCRSLAIADSSGTAVFYELPMDGNGSLLKPNVEQWAKATQWEYRQVKSFQVELSTLNDEISSNKDIDLLWVDVQGAEAAVLRGGKEVLQRTRAVFLEVALVESPYRGAMLFQELNSMLSEKGFTCVGLGTDAWSYGGNALWIHDIKSRIYKQTAA